MDKKGLQAVLDNVAATTAIEMSAAADFKAKTQPIRIQMSGANDFDGFYLSAHRGPMSWILELSWGDFARELINLTASNLYSHFDLIAMELKRIEHKGISFETNLSAFKEFDSALTPPVFALKVFMTDGQDQYKISPESEIKALTSLLSESVCLIDGILRGFSAEVEPRILGDFEGERSWSECVKYERSSWNRQRCLDFYGFVCAACELSPEQKYGPEGRKIIHVHHRMPVSQMSGPGRLNPIKDLVPLCPNCHNFAHKRNPPIPIEEIKSILGLDENLNLQEDK